MMMKKGKEALDEIRHAGLDIEDFAYGYSGVAGYFAKVAKEGMVAPGKRVMQVLEDPSGWYTASSPNKSLIETLVSQSLGGRLEEILEFYEIEILREYTYCQCDIQEYLCFWNFEQHIIEYP